MSNLSPSTLALLRAAKQDAPSRESRAAIWGGVTSGLVTHTPLHITPQANAGAGANAGGASMAPQAAAAAGKSGLLVASSLTGMKGAFIGALFGSAISIGVATFMLRTKPVDVPRAPISAQASTQVGDSSKSNNGSNSVSASTTQASSATASTNASPTDVQELDALLPNAANASGASKSGSSQNSGTSAIAAGSLDKSSSTQSSASNAKSLTDETQSLHSKKSSTGDQNLSLEDMLSREVALVREARRDLLAGDAAAALKTVRMARSLEARQMEPEEMNVEAKALRELGRYAEAEKVESQRRTMYPNAL